MVKWRRLGLRIEFYNFGVGDSDASDCEPDVGMAQTFMVEGRNFRTWRGLRAGMREGRVEDLHPNASWVENHRFFRDGYWLREKYSPIGDGGEYPVVSGRVDVGRLTERPDRLGDG